MLVRPSWRFLDRDEARKCQEGEEPMSVEAARACSGRGTRSNYGTTVGTGSAVGVLRVTKGVAAFARIKLRARGWDEAGAGPVSGCGGHMAQRRP